MRNDRRRERELERSAHPGESKRLAQGKLLDAILPGGLLSVNKSTLIQ
jgi:hypothetical protein